MASGDTKWVFNWDMWWEARKVKRHVRDTLEQKNVSGMEDDDEEEAFGIVRVKKEDVEAFHKAIGEYATIGLYDVAENSPMFIDGALLLFYVGMGASNALYPIGTSENSDKRNPMTILQRICMYPDVPSSTLRLFLGLAREYYTGPFQLLFEVPVDYSDPTVVGGNTATHLSVLSADFAPTHSRDEYFSSVSLEKVKILWQREADFHNVENNDGLTPVEIVKMFAGKWDPKVEDPHELMSDVVMKPRHILTQFSAQSMLEFFHSPSPLLKLADMTEKDEDPIAVDIRNARWSNLQNRIIAERDRVVKDSRWLVSTKNRSGLPLIWYFAGFMYNAAEHYPFSRGYVPVVEFHAMLDLYKLHPPSGVSREEIEDDLRRLFWFSVGASFRFVNKFDGDGIPINPFLGIERGTSMPPIPSQDALADKLERAEEQHVKQAEVDKAETRKSTDDLPKLVKDGIRLRKAPNSNEYALIKFHDALEAIKWPYLDNPIALTKLQNPASLADAFIQLAIPFVAYDLNEYQQFTFTRGILDPISTPTLNKYSVFIRSLPTNKWQEKISVDRAWSLLSVGEGTDKKKRADDVTQFILRTPDVAEQIVQERSQKTQSIIQNDDTIYDDYEEPASSAASSSTTRSSQGEEVIITPAEKKYADAFDPRDSFARTFFAGVVAWDGYEKARQPGGFLAEKTRVTSTHFVASQIHYAMRVGDPEMLNRVSYRGSDASELRHPSLNSLPIQTAIASGHSPSTIFKLHQALQNLKAPRTTSKN